MTETVDVAIIGAGPAGMAAARDLKALGLRVLVLDERAGPGGNVHASALDRPQEAASVLGGDYARGVAEARGFAASGVPARYGCSVSRVAGETIHYLQHGRLHRITAARLVLATGAIERPVPFPGWELPGIMGAGAFQLMLKQSRVVPAGDYVLCGTGPLVLLMACQLLALGSRPLAVLDTNSEAAPLGIGLSHLPTLARNAGAVAKGLSYMARLRLAGIPVISGVTRLEARGSDAVQAIRYTRRNGSSASLDVRMVLFHEGVIPNTQLGLALDCKHRWDEHERCLIPETDAYGESSRQGTFIIGDAAGILGASAAPHSARLAAMKIAQDLGCRLDDEAGGAVEAARRALNRERRFRAFLDRAYRPGLAFAAPITDETMICRCEQVTAGALRQAVRDGARGPAQAKVFTRCGMGLCQGRICGNVVTRLIAEETGLRPRAVGGYHIRFPLKPMSLIELADELPMEEPVDEHIA
ncbi:NAD(P)/FAD-dependent oxidoreductase [Frigidibacter sp.]|uniref:FAD/NAD(P)-dependent oxidoreductase n=1 Tax=Frigidibacter sp. TaxID=2586418 RepID=UPI0027333EB5|nr:FAD-dependent oxidoreductase [Frigidibacter sp.]MDP3342359.1 FAD-dependent oxidoreductase [Frigidibacter sp.]